MDVKVLDKWAELLLDMGKRNNLVNFKNAKMGTAEIVAPDFATIFHRPSTVQPLRFTILTLKKMMIWKWLQMKW